MHPHEIGAERQHERGLDLAAVNAVRLLLLAEQVVGIAEAAL
jgi:hypothetical protein